LPLNPLQGEDAVKICVFGTGGVGGYFGARLAQCGADVTFIARGDHLDAMREDGLRVTSIVGDVRIYPVAATDEPADVGEVDAVLLGVKAWQVREAAEAMAPLLGSETVVVPLQNGIETPDHLKAVIGGRHVAGGLCRIISFIEVPGVIRHSGAKPFIAFGELDNRPSRRMDRLRDWFSKAVGVDVVVKPDIQRAMWEKFVMISAWSGLGAITRAPVGTLCRLPETRGLLTAMMDEAAAVAKARGSELGGGISRQQLALMDTIPPETTTSMQRDLLLGRPSELMEQNGAVVRLGGDRGIDTPVNAVVYYCLLPQELKARGL
jgi:2-dehydropantoate 2-reductase